MAGVSDFLVGQRVLVITPHADDESLGCAGTIAKLKKLGSEVYCLLGSLGGIEQYLSPGPGADPGNPAPLRFVSGAERRSEFRAVMELLGVDGWEVMFGNDLHLALDTLPLRQVIARIERDGPLSIESLRPSMLLMPAPTFNQDHETVYRACLAATRPSAPGRRHLVPTVLVYDNGTAYWSQHPTWFTPNFYVDVSDFVDLKRRALATYVSQLGGLTEAVPVPSQAHLAVYGERISVAAAEAFQVLRIAV